MFEVAAAAAAADVAKESNPALISSVVILNEQHELEHELEHDIRQTKQRETKWQQGSKNETVHKMKVTCLLMWSNVDVRARWQWCWWPSSIFFSMKKKSIVIFTLKNKAHWGWATDQKRVFFARLDQKKLVARCTNVSWTKLESGQSWDGEKVMAGDEWVVGRDDFGWICCVIGWFRCVYLDNLKFFI